MSIDQAAPGPGGYEQFFGFVEPPFSLSVNTRFRYESASHREALSQVTYGLERREPIIVVTGEIGMGKTLLCRTVVERLSRKTFLSVINDPILERDELLKRILEDFGVISSRGAGPVQTSRHELVHALEKFLASLSQLDAHGVVIVDEAQHVRPDVLEEIRLIANIHDSRGTLLQMLLVGQPSLRVLLDAPQLAQLRQRITRFVSLDPLSHDEVKHYISHRLTVARETPTSSNVPGARDLATAVAEWNELSRPVTFTDDAITAVTRVSWGVPRVVNLVCDRALESACQQQTRTVEAPHVTAAASLLRLPTPDSPKADIAATEDVPAATVAPPPAPAGSRGYIVAAVAAAAVLAAAVWVGIATMRPASIAPPSAAAAPTAARPSTPPDAASRDLRPTAPIAAPSGAAAPVAAPSPAPPVGAAPSAEKASTDKAPPAPAAAATPPGRESFELLVASFRTEARATEVAKQIAAMGQSVRQRSLGGWQQVLAGPYASRAAADEAKQQLARAGFNETFVVRETR